jgi:hypothetical protein
MQTTTAAAHSSGRVINYCKMVCMKHRLYTRITGMLYALPALLLSADEARRVLHGNPVRGEPATGLGSANFPTVVGPLGAGMGMMLDVPVTIPTNATNGQMYPTTITATSQGDTNQTASVTLTTTALVEDTGHMIFLPLVLKGL